MLERKGIEFRRYDITAVLTRAVLPRLGFPGGTVPALIVDGVHLQGTRTLSRALDVLRPEPPLFPRDPALREAVERAEHWGDQVLQPVPRRISWAAIKRDRAPLVSFLEGSRMGIPPGLAAKTAGPIVWAAARLNHASDRQVHADLQRLPVLLDRVDDLIADGVIGRDEPNAADYQIGTSVRLMLCFDDLRPAIEGRPAEDHAKKVVPPFPGHVPRVFPASWLTSLTPDA